MNKNQTLEILRESLGITKKEFANSIGITQNAYTNYIQGKRDIPTNVALKIKQLFDINLNWLLTGEGSMKEDCNSKDKSEIEVNIYDDIYSLLDSNNQNISSKKVTLSKAFLKSLYINNPQNIEIVKVLGNNLEPIFKDGDYIVIEKVNSFNEVKNGNIIIFTVDKELYVKRVRKELPDHTIFLTNIDGNDSHSVELKEELLKRLNLIGIIRGKYKAL